MGPIYEFGIQLIQSLQTLSPALDGVMDLISFIGTLQFYMLLIPLVYWLVDASMGFRVLLVLVSADFLAASLKQLLHQPRPYWVGDVKPLAQETSYGVPSSHSSDSLAVWGYLAYRIKKSWMWVLSTVIILLIGLSRMYLGVHFPQDVLVGWLVGLVALILFVWGEARVAAWFQKFSTGGQIGIAFVISLLMILIGWLNLLLISSSPDPAGWAKYSTQARTIYQYITLGGFLFGAVAGYVLMRRYAAFETKGAWWQLLVRYGVGLAGVFLLFMGLDVLFSMIAADESILGMVLRYIRYGTVSLWGIFGAPWVFLKLKLAAPAEA